MNKIIYLEPEEEIIGIIDRLKKIDEEKIALVIPAGSLVFSSAVNLKLLKEEGGKIKKDISIVTSDVAGRNIANQIGFTVYEDLGEARETKEKDKKEQERKEERGGRESKLEEKVNVVDESDNYTNIEKLEKHKGEMEEGKENTQKEGVLHGKGIVSKNKSSFSQFFSNPKFWILGTITIVIVLFLLIFIFPHATIYLNVYAEESEVDIPFGLSVEGGLVNTGEEKTIPALWEIIEREVAVEVKTTGEKNVGDKAKGAITIYNRSGKVQIIPAGSEFVAQNNKVFVNPEDISVSGAMVSDFGELIPGKSSGMIEALEGGSSYNMESSRFSIPSLGSMSSLVYGISEESISGGSDKQAKVITAEDIERGKEEARDRAEEELENEFGVKGDKIFVRGLAKVNILEESVEGEEDEEKEEFEVKMKAQFSFLSFARSSFDELFNESINLQVSDQKTLIGEGYRSVKWDVSNFDEDEGRADIVARAIVLVATKINEDFLRSKVTNLDIAELRSVLSDYPEVELDRVRFFPPLFISSIPSNERNIDVEVRYIEQSLSIKEWEFSAG